MTDELETCILAAPSADHPPPNRAHFLCQVFEEPATDVLFPVVPLIKVEAAGAVILAPGLKVRVSGGMNYPSKAAFSIGAVYLIGAR